MQQKSEKINEEKIKCQHMADLAQADLAEAMPALEEAVKVYSLLIIALLSFSAQVFAHFICTPITPIIYDNVQDLKLKDEFSY